MKKIFKRFSLILIVFFTIFALFPAGAYAETNLDQIFEVASETRYDICLTGSIDRMAAPGSPYAAGNYWVGSFDRAALCYGFGKLALYQVHGVRGVSWGYDGEDLSGMTLVGRLSYGEYTSEKLNELFRLARPGDIVQMSAGGRSQHTMMLYAYHPNADDPEQSYITIFDCNGWSGPNRIGFADFSLSPQGDKYNRLVAGTHAYLSIVRPVAPESISLDKSSMTMVPGERQTLTATATPDIYKSFNVSTSDPLVVLVDAAGTVRALSAGSAIITVTTKDGGVRAQCAVQVLPQGIDTDTIL